MNNPNRLSTGQILNNRYRIVRLLGQGGFGAVYRAWDVNLSLPCALKENTETSPEAARQFLREAQLLHTLRHPNLPLVKDHFVIPGQGQYLVMDYIEGQDLQEKITAGGITISQAVGWVLQICDALAYMHTQDPAVIHRDIKPANIKITSQGRAVLVDFGIAKVFDANSRTTAGARAVTAGFSPFEQYGSAPTDARTDVYALGATLYALLTGQEPVESIARVAGTELASPRSLNPEISLGLEQVLLKSLAVMPAGRYQSIVDFKDALIAQVGEMPELVTPTSPKPQMQPSGSIETLAVEEPAIARRPPSGPPAARPPSTPRSGSRCEGSASQETPALEMDHHHWRRGVAADLRSLGILRWQAVVNRPRTNPHDPPDRHRSASDSHAHTPANLSPSYRARRRGLHPHGGIVCGTGDGYQRHNGWHVQPGCLGGDPTNSKRAWRHRQLHRNGRRSGFHCKHHHLC